MPHDNRYFLLLLSVVLFITSFAVVVWQSYFQLQEQYLTSNREIKGVLYHRALFNLSSELHGLERSGFFHSFEKGIGDWAGAETKWKEIIKSIEEVDAIDHKYGRDIYLTEDWKKIRNRLRKFSLDYQKKNKQQYARKLDNFIFDFENMMLDAGDRSALVTDPKPDSYYLMDITVNSMPVITMKISDFQEVLKENGNLEQIKDRVKDLRETLNRTQEAYMAVS